VQVVRDRKPRAQKRGPRTHYSAAQKGTATGDGSGELPVGPTTSKGLLPVGQPLKAIACVQVLTKRRLSSFSTTWNFTLRRLTLKVGCVLLVRKWSRKIFLIF
jgi:hypothetical protein